MMSFQPGPPASFAAKTIRDDARPPSLLRDRQFLLALAAGPLTLLLMTWWWPAWHAGIRPDVLLALSVVLWQPLLEELLFRGVVQGWLATMPWARRRLAGVSAANGVTTMLFVSAHLVVHAPVWAAAVAGPSLLFGYFRERYGQVHPAILLHAFYNGCYLAAGLLLNRASF